LDIEIASARTTVRGRLDYRSLSKKPEFPCGFSEITLETFIESPEAVERIRELMALAERECRAVDTLLRPTPVISVVNLNGQEVQRLSLEPKKLSPTKNDG
jgi:hypothetical protein